jgi:alkylation response protein AidB-like acyl-CoA dehydrogenase
MPDEYPLYAPSEEHREIRKVVRELAEEKIAPFAAEVDEDARYPEEAAAALLAADFHAPHVPEQYGGAGADALATVIVIEEIARVCMSSSLIPAVNKLGSLPVQIAGSEELKEKYLGKLARGEGGFSYCLSEPDAGSDAAGMTTRAVRDGDEWVISGQKVWTSGAQYSDIGEIITRTDPDKPKHKGLTMFLMDMHAPGVEIRPLRQMTGGASFNEVFLNEVRVPDSHRLGDVDEGWGVALTTLMNERASIGGGGAGGGGAGTGTGRLIEMAQRLGVATDPIVRQKLVALFVHSTVARYTNLRAMAKVKAGQTPGPEMSIAKLALTQNGQRTAALVSDILGPRLSADTGEWGTYAWSEFVLGVPGMRVAGGTDEVMRNIVGERVLGLPKEPRANA